MTTRFTAGFRVLVILGALTVGVTPASADWLLTPYLGITFNGGANFGDIREFNDNFKKRPVYGGSLTWMGDGVAGVEFDVGVARNFFENTDPTKNVGTSTLTTLMANAVLGAPIGGQHGAGLRPYAGVGFGLIRSNIKPTTVFNKLSANDLGINVGGGLMGFFADNIGLRADVRYYRALQDTKPNGRLDLGLSDFRFWRGTFGVTFRFGN